MSMGWIEQGVSKVRAAIRKAFMGAALVLGIAAALSVAAALLVAGSASAEGPIQLSAGSGYTLVNLHPDEGRSRLYAVNYQQAGLIPVCTQVQYVSLDRKKFVFRVAGSGREYTYINHKAAGEPFENHLGRFFGPNCPKSEVDALKGVDMEGVRMGRPLVGMSRRAVVLALGWPPRHVNPMYESPTWKYWRSRFDTFNVLFGVDGRVLNVQN